MKTNLPNIPAVWPLAILLLLPALARAESAFQAWVQSYTGPGSGSARIDNAAAVKVDGSNNVIVTGYSMGSGTYNDYATIKYSSSGVPLWTNRYDGPASSTDGATALAIDSSNNVIVTGSSDGGAGSSLDYATIKYSSSGVPLWTNRYSAPVLSADRAYAVAVDGADNVIVTGYSSGLGSGADFTTIKYSSDGAPLWTNRFTRDGAYDDLAAALVVDGNNDVIVTGSSFSSMLVTSCDYATVKYSSDGVPLWTNLYDGPGTSIDMPSAVAVDGNNDVIVTGKSCGTAGYFDYATIKYSSAGVPLWTNRHVNGSPSALAVDSHNNVLVTGRAAGTSVYPYNYDYGTIKYSSAGVPLWTNRYNGPGDNYDEALALVVDRGNNVLVTGYSAGTNVDSYNYDYATIKYSSDGVPLWTVRYNGPGNSDDEPSALAVDHNGDVLVTGYATGLGGNVDYATIKYIYVPSPLITPLELSSGSFRMRLEGVLPSGTLVVQAATNLAHWVPLFTNTTPTNVLFYTDPEAGKYPWRFYRAYQSP